MFWQCVVLFITASSAYAADHGESEHLADTLRRLDGRVILRGEVSRQPMAAMLSRSVAAELRSANRRDRAAWSKIETKADWERMRKASLAALRTSLGRFPKVPDDLRVEVVGTVKGDGFEVDKLVFQSRPGIVVTANLYRPAKPRESMPGVIVCHSHIRPKETGARQAMGATWARAGCLVYVPDHLGHGERRQHPFRSSADYDQPFRVSSQDYYFRYDSGIQLHLIGESLMGWLAWDLWRGVDVLLDQPGVDRQRIVMISEPAGGGDAAAVAGALDERIAGVMVNNFGGPEPENGYPLPADAESWFPYVSSGSWESTRNLRLSARDGFAPWAIAASLAPRKFIYYHEFYWDREQDPIWKRLQTVYRFYNTPDSLAGLAGHGFVVGSSPQNTHWIPYSREMLFPVLERWFDIANPRREYDKLLPEESLLCLTPRVKTKHRPMPLHRVCAKLGAERAATIRRRLSRLPALDRRDQLRRLWSALLGDIDAKVAPIVKMLEQEQLAEITIDRIQLETEPGIIVPVVLLVPNKAAGPRQTVICVAQAGKQAFLRSRSQQIAELLEGGAAVCLLDVRGTGETDPGDGRRRRSSATTLSSSELMLGQTLLGARLRDLRQVLRYLHEREELDNNRFALWGDSFAPVNAADCNFAVPRGISQRPHPSEPLGGMLALLGALFDDKVNAVYVHGGLAGFQDVLDSPFCYLPHDAVVPGVLTVGDLVEVAATIAPRPLRLENLVDGQNRRLSAARTRQIYGHAKDSYLKARAKENLTIADGKLSAARWLLDKEN